MRPYLPYVDYLFPNLEEARLVTGLKDPEQRLFFRLGLAILSLNWGPGDVCVPLPGNVFIPEPIPMPAVWIPQAPGTLSQGDLSMEY